jgi:cytochrome c-type biogenesis protein CcmE
MDEERPSQTLDDPPAVTYSPAERTESRRQPEPARQRGYGRWLGLGTLGAVIALVASTIRPGHGALVYSKYVDEVLADRARFTNTEVRVEGIVSAGTIRNQPGSEQYLFSIERNHRSMPVRYAGVIPDTFRDGIGVTVRGRLQPNGQFVAHELVAKCPSKYEMQAAQARGTQMPPLGASATPGM